MVLIPASLAVAILFVPTWIHRTVQAKTETKVDAKALARQAEALSKKISSQRQAIDKDKFPEAEKLLAQIEKKTEDLAKAPPGAERSASRRDEQADRRPQGTARSSSALPTRSIDSFSSSRKWARAARPTSSPRN